MVANDDDNDFVACSSSNTFKNDNFTQHLVQIDFQDDDNDDFFDNNQFTLQMF